MENQHQHIRGYRDLTQQEIDLMNEGKALAEQVGAYCEKVKNLAPPAAQANITIDGRWLAIGVTHLQQGFMAVIRSIARPTTF